MATLSDALAHAFSLDRRASGEADWMEDAVLLVEGGATHAGLGAVVSGRLPAGGRAACGFRARLTRVLRPPAGAGCAAAAAVDGRIRVPARRRHAGRGSRHRSAGGFSGHEAVCRTWT